MCKAGMTQYNLVCWTIQQQLTRNYTITAVVGLGTFTDAVVAFCTDYATWLGGVFFPDAVTGVLIDPIDTNQTVLTWVTGTMINN